MQERLQSTIPNSNKWHNEDVEVKAKKLGMEKSEFILNAVDMMMNFDEIFFKRIQEYSNGLHIPEWLVIQNMIIKRMADEAAECEVFGQNGKVLDEFIMTGEGNKHETMTGEKLFNFLKDQSIQKYERKAVKMLLQEESYGVPLNDKDKALLIKHRTGKAWIESDEYKKEQTAREEYKNLMKKYGIPENNDPSDEIVTEEELNNWEYGIEQ